MENSCYSLTPNIDNTTIFVTFSGRKLGMASMTFFEFKNFLQENYPTINQHFFMDKKTLWYTKGIDGVTTNVDETIHYLKEITKGYTNVIFIGSSMGGYAAILYGSILNVSHVIAFRPQTIIYLEDNTEFDPNYLDLEPILNNTTKYDIIGDSEIIDPTDIHSFSHCERIQHHENVHLTAIPDFDIKAYRNEGKLIDFFKQIFSS
jgi:hypothetical protein